MQFYHIKVSYLAPPNLISLSSYQNFQLVLVSRAKKREKCYFHDKLNNCEGDKNIKCNK